MPSGQINATASVGGLSIPISINREDTGQIGQGTVIPAGKDGAMSAAAEITLELEHGFLEADVVDVYWDKGLRYGCVVDAKTTTTITLSGGAADALPALTTAVVVSKQVEVDTDFDGAKLVMIAVGADTRAHVDFQDNLAASLLPRELAANEGWLWSSNEQEEVQVTPIDGIVDRAMASNGDSTKANLFQIGILYKSVGSE